jgi:hypothetical protein
VFGDDAAGRVGPIRCFGPGHELRNMTTPRRAKELFPSTCASSRVSVSSSMYSRVQANANLFGMSGNPFRGSILCSSESFRMTSSALNPFARGSMTFSRAGVGA